MSDDAAVKAILIPDGNVGAPPTETLQGDADPFVPVVLVRLLSKDGVGDPVEGQGLVRGFHDRCLGYPLIIPPLEGCGNPLDPARKSGVNVLLAD